MYQSNKEAVKLCVLVHSVTLYVLIGNPDLSFTFSVHGHDFDLQLLTIAEYFFLLKIKSNFKMYSVKQCMYCSQVLLAGQLRHNILNEQPLI